MHTIVIGEDYLMKIIAHPDDIELACGGTLADSIKKGHDDSNSSVDHYGNSIRTDFEANAWSN